MSLFKNIKYITFTTSTYFYERIMYRYVVLSFFLMLVSGTAMANDCQKMMAEIKTVKDPARAEIILSYIIDNSCAKGFEKSLYYQRGLLRTALGNHQGAYEDFSRLLCLGLPPKDQAGIYGRRSSAALELDNVQGAMEDIDAARTVYPEWDIYFAKLGKIQMKQGNFEDAIKSFNTYIKGGKANPAAYIERGDCYWELKKFDKAAQDYRKIHDANPGYDSIWPRLIHIYSKNRQYEDLITVLDNIIERYPRGNFLYLRANAYFERYFQKENLDDINKSLDYIQEAGNQKLSDSDRERMETLEAKNLFILAHKKLRGKATQKEFIAACDKALSKKIHYHDQGIMGVVYFDVGDVLYGLGEYSKAVDTLTYAIYAYDKKSKFRYLPYEIRAKAHAAMGNYKKAMDDLDMIQDITFFIDDLDRMINNDLQREYYTKLLDKTPAENSERTIPWVRNRDGAIGYPYDISPGMESDNALAILKSRYSEVIDRFAIAKEGHWDMVGASDGSLKHTLRIFYDRFEVYKIELYVTAKDTPGNREKLKKRYLEISDSLQTILPFNNADDRSTENHIRFRNHNRKGKSSENIAMNYDVSDGRVEVQTTITLEEKGI